MKLEITRVTEEEPTVTELSEYGLIEVNGNFYIKNSFNLKRPLEDSIKKILGDTSVKITKPRKLKVKVAEDRFLFDSRRAIPHLLTVDFIEKWKAGNAHNWTEGGAYEKRAGPEVKKVLGLDWRGIDHTVWVYDKRAKLFKPVPCIREIKIPEGSSVRRKALEEVLASRSRCKGVKWYNEHCYDCGGHTMLIKWRELPQEAGKKEFQNVYSSWYSWLDKFFPGKKFRIEEEY